MPPAPIPANDAERLTALLGCRILDTNPEADFDDLTSLAARLCDAPVALVSLVDRDRQWFKSRVGLDTAQTPRSQAFCGYTILSEDPLVIHDATKDPRTRDNPLVTAEPNIRAYAGVPIRLSTGHALGSLCVIDLQPREFTPQQIDDLIALARQVSAQLELRKDIHELEIAAQRARAADAAKSIFLANMSHEIRTPMTAILGYADLVATDEALAADPTRVQEVVGTIRRNSSHLLAVINDILDVSRIEAGRLTVERLETNPADIVRQSIELFIQKACEAGTELKVEFDTPVPDAILSDPTRLRQVLINLVGNAVKFTTRGSVTVRLAHDTHNDTTRFTVTDTGVGMSEDLLQRIQRLEAFTQAANATPRNHGGSGLGLRIAHALAKKLGGNIHIESTLGRGTTAEFTVAAEPLPHAGFVESLASANIVAAAERAEVADRPLAGRHVLLAEDTLDTQRLIALHLGRAGATVTFVENGVEAISAIENADRPVDLLLLDMQMPVLDGYNTASRLRAAGVTTPIIAVTAHAMAEDRDRCLAAGCDDYLTKPVDRDDLIRACVRALRRNRSRLRAA